MSRRKVKGRVAQSVEHSAFNGNVAGSIPAAPTTPHEPGFWVRVNEPDARAIITGVLPESVREQFRQMMADHDAHLAICQAALDAHR